MALTQAAADIRYYLGPTDGSAIDPALHQVSYLIGEEIVWAAGGQRLDHAVFRWNLSDSTAPINRVANLQTPAGWNRQVEVRLYTDASTFLPLFWGDLTAQRVRVDQQEEAVVTASVFPYHFGITLRGMLTYSPSTEQNEELAEDIVFNPFIDGVVEKNMDERTAGPHHLWVDPESVRTTEAQAYREAFLPDYWTLEEAVKALCWICNPYEDYVKNPDDFSMFNADTPRPDNVRIARGKYLPFYLDSILHPYGYDWCLSLTQSGTATERRIKIFRRDSGPEKTVTMQAVGSTLDLSTTNCHAFDVSVDVGGLANRVIVSGGRKQFEITFELYRGWEEADDSLDEADLKKSDETSQYNTADKKRVWRLWVGNEAGDWNETRTTAPNDIPDAPRDWSEFGVLVPRRRKIEDCLSLGEDGRRLDPVLEWSDDGGVTWYPPGEQHWHWRIYETQIAISFEGDVPPPELMLAGDDARLRVTCTITGDERIIGETGDRFGNPSPDSPNGRPVELYIDASDRFLFRQVQEVDPFGSAVWNRTPTPDTDERDDQEAIQYFAEYVLDREQAAVLNAAIALIGITKDYSVGDVLTAISGRAISLNRSSATGFPKYPQITSVIWRPQAQVTELVTTAAEVDPSYMPGARLDGEV